MEELDTGSALGFGFVFAFVLPWTYTQHVDESASGGDFHLHFPLIKGPPDRWQGDVSQCTRIQE